MNLLPDYPLQNLKEIIPFNIALLGQRRSGKSVSTFKICEYLMHEFDLILTFLGTKFCNPELMNLIEENFDSSVFECLTKM